MNRIGRLSRRWRSVSSLLAAALLVSGASASLCVWRSPDTDIAEIYDATSYKTVFEDIDDVLQLTIEERLGTELDPDETQFKFFPVYSGDVQVGTVMTHVGKGQFGAIEVVVAAVDTDSGPVVKAVRIQRDREKAKQALRGNEFLGQFRGKGVDDPFVIGEDLETAANGADAASQAVATAVRKLLVVYDTFYGRGEPSDGTREPAAPRGQGIEGPSGGPEPGGPNPATPRSSLRSFPGTPEPSNPRTPSP